MISDSQPGNAGAAPDKSQLKAQGLAFGQAFQTVFKVSAMYSVDHPAAGRSIQQTWDLLSPFLKNGRPFTFGFMNQRLLLNSTLVSTTNLTHLEVEFTKREIAAVTFYAGLTLKDFKRALALIATRPKVIAERGGIKKFLEENSLEGARVTPAPKPTNEGDTVEVGMDMESFLTARAILGEGGSSGTSALDMLMDAAGEQKRQGAGVSPQELAAVAETATRNTVADPDGNVAELLLALTQMLSAMQPDFFAAALPPQRRADLVGNSAEVMSAHLMEDAIASWAAERLAAKSGVGGTGTGGGQGGEAGEGAGEGKGPGAGGEGQGNVEKEVLQALLRGLKATRVAERLMQKLAQFVEQANLPREVFERIHQEVLWFTLPKERKHTQLLESGRSTTEDFARLVQYVQEAMSDGKISDATEIAQHYFSTWEKAPSAVRAEEMKRAPELLRALASVQTLPLMHQLAEPMMREILDETRLHWPCHIGATNCLAVIAQNSGRFEDFEFVQKLASDLRRSMNRLPSQHAECCGKALAGLLTAEALERLIESFLQKRNDPAWARTATSLIMMMGAAGAEGVWRRLEEEPTASNRMPLIRLIRSLGASAIEPVCKRLSDSRWYVVRNAAYILGDLGDPELPAHLQGVLAHEELRVQQAALMSLLKSDDSGRAAVLAQALPHLQAGVLEMALDELTVLKDPATVGHLEALVCGKKEFKAGAREKAVIALGAVPCDRAAEVLYKIIRDTAQPLLVRRTALGGLYNHGSSLSQSLVAKLASLSPTDPLAAEVQKVA